MFLRGSVRTLFSSPIAGIFLCLNGVLLDLTVTILLTIFLGDVVIPGVQRLPGHPACKKRIRAFLKDWNSAFALPTKGNTPLVIISV